MADVGVLLYGSPGAVPAWFGSDRPGVPGGINVPHPHPNHYEAANKTMAVLKGRNSYKGSIRDWPSWGWGPGCHICLVGTPEMSEK